MVQANECCPQSRAVVSVDGFGPGRIEGARYNGGALPATSHAENATNPRKGGSASYLHTQAFVRPWS